MTDLEAGAVEALRPLLEERLRVLDERIRQPDLDALGTAFLRGQAIAIAELLKAHEVEVALQMMADANEMAEAERAAKAAVPVMSRVKRLLTLKKQEITPHGRGRSPSD